MIAIVSHDAGGAEILASLVARQKLDCVFVLEGPAVEVFRRRLGPIQSVGLEWAVQSSDSVICGTSWQSDLEWRAVVAAKSNQRRVVSYIDHWGHYLERFTRNGLTILPDEIWVGDAVAFSKAVTIFPQLTVRLEPNPYFADIIEQLSNLSDRAHPDGDVGLSVLFVCEPLSDHGRLDFNNELHWGYTEFDALRYLYRNLASLGDRVRRLTIRPHPSERSGKYDDIAREFGDVALVGGKRSLLEEISDCDVVAGCQSMAMVVGLLANKRVVAAIPPGGIACALPQVEIEPLTALVARSAASKSHIS